MDTDDLLQHGKGGMLAALVSKAADGPARLFLQDRAVQHAPLVTRPEDQYSTGTATRDRVDALP